MQYMHFNKLIANGGLFKSGTYLFVLDYGEPVLSTAEGHKRIVLRGSYWVNFKYF